MATVLQDLNNELAGVVDGVERSLVRIESVGRGYGAGTVWHPEGLVITNAHVVGRGPLRVGLADGCVYPARVLAYDARLDLAALWIDAHELPTIAPGDSLQLRPGEWVVAVGHPWGVAGAATGGVVIGVGNVGPGQWGAPWQDRDLIAAGVHLRPGHSGGPMVDVQGQLVGINTMMHGPDVGLAVPAHVVKAFLRENLGSQRMAA